MYLTVSFLLSLALFHVMLFYMIKVSAEQHANALKCLRDLHKEDVLLLLQRLSVQKRRYEDLEREYKRQRMRS